LQAVFNVLLLVPLGVYLRYYFRFGLVWSAVAAFGLSLLFEITQVTGLYGIYECPYRLFDVDDLMLNTVGGLLGYAAAPLLMRILPPAAKLDEKVDLVSEKVGLTRRWIALQLDLLVLFPAALLFMRSGDLRIYAIVCLLYFIVLPYFTNGRTLGKAIVRIRVQGQGARVSLKELLIRYGVLYGGIAGLHALFVWGAAHDAPPLLLALCLGTTACVDIAFAIHLGLRLLSRDKILFYERWSGTKHGIF
jgi:uncharacterized RDD family membrane protein YckC